MPILARFYGIVIRMYFLGSEHNPPPLQAIYGATPAAVDIRTGGGLDGELPARAAALVREWVGLHRDALIEMWQTQEFRRLEPLD